MGFPTRPSRSAFGPQYVNKRPVIRNDREIGQEIFNLLFWQVAGLSVAGAVALLRIAIATNLLRVAPAVQTLSDQHVVAKHASDKRTIDVRLRNSAGTLINLT